MAQVLVRDLDAATVARLKRRAKENARSLQTELKLILEGASAERRGDFAAAAEAIRRRLSRRRHSDSARLLAQDRRR